MSITFCFALAAAFFGLALTATTPADAYVEAGVELSEWRGRQALLSYRLVFSSASSRLHPARRGSTIK